MRQSKENVRLHTSILLLTVIDFRRLIIPIDFIGIFKNKLQTKEFFFSFSLPALTHYFILSLLWIEFVPYFPK